MPDHGQHWRFMRAELGRLPDSMRKGQERDRGVVFHDLHSVDSKDMSDGDLVFHHARRTHAESLTAIATMLRDVWFDAEMELRGSTSGMQDDEVEMLFVDRLSRWLRDHAAYVAQVVAGGETKPELVKAGPGRLGIYLEGHRLYAARHHEMIADYCARVATALEHRAAELRKAMSYSNSH